MDFAQFLAAVARMRKLQKDYFRTRDPAVLEECKRAERAIDAELAAREAARVPNLFDVIDSEG